MSADRTIVIPSQYMGGVDAILELETPDGERGDMTLSVAGEVIARGEGFGSPAYGPNLLEHPEWSLAGIFASFLEHALESSEDDARNGWPILTDAASEWVDALNMLTEGREF